jgi:heptosyltransferase-2
MVQNYLDFARKLGSKYNTDKLIPLEISEHDKRIVANFLKNNKITKKDFTVGLTPGIAESVKYRMWPIENFAKLADELIKKHDAKIIFIDSKINKSMIEKIQKHMLGHSINAAGIFNVKQAAELIKNCNMFVSNDSGLMHISAAMGTKTIGLFGPNTPVLWAPYGKGNVSIFKPKKGIPYLDNTKRELVPKKLTKEQLTVMDKIEVDDVMKVVEKLK